MNPSSASAPQKGWSPSITLSAEREQLKGARYHHRAAILVTNQVLAAGAAADRVLVVEGVGAAVLGPLRPPRVVVLHLAPRRRRTECGLIIALTFAAQSIFVFSSTQ